MKKLSVLATALIVAFSVNASPESKTEPLVLPAIAQDVQHATASKRITALFTRGHYTHVQLDDELSSRMFDTYLKNLDYYRNVLTKADIDTFEQYRDKFDDAINKGNLNFAFDMFNLTLKRRFERFDYAQKLLEKGFDFNVEDQYIYDREEANWATSTAELDEIWRQRVKFDALNLKLAGTNAEEIQTILKKRYHNSQKRLTQSESEDVFQLIMNSFARSIEAHTSYLSPRNADRFQQEMNLQLEGIGAVLRADEHAEAPQHECRNVHGRFSFRAYQLQAGDGPGAAVGGQLIDGQIDAEQVAEALGVAGEGVEVVQVGQLLLELAQVQVEPTKILGDVERALGNHVVLAHVTGRGAVAGDPQQAHQADHAAIAGAVLQHQRGPGGALAQVLGGDFTGATVLLVGPRATHVGHQVAVAAAAFGFARGGVEVDDRRRHQHRRHGIEQGRLARAGTADEQEAALGDRYFGQAVEGAPVVHLQAAHAELLQARVRQAFVEQGGSVLGNGHGVLAGIRLRQPGFRAAGGTPPRAGTRLRRRTAASAPARLRGGHPGR